MAVSNEMERERSAGREPRECSRKWRRAPEEKGVCSFLFLRFFRVREAEKTKTVFSSFLSFFFRFLSSPRFPLLRRICFSAWSAKGPENKNKRTGGAQGKVFRLLHCGLALPPSRSEMQCGRRLRVVKGRARPGDGREALRGDGGCEAEEDDGVLIVALAVVARNCSRSDRRQRRRGRDQDERRTASPQRRAHVCPAARRLDELGEAEAVAAILASVC